MHKIKTLFRAMLLLLLSGGVAAADDVVWYDGLNPVSVGFDTETDLVVKTAMEMFSSDMVAVTGRQVIPVKPARATVRVTQLDKADKSVRNKLSKLNIPVTTLDTLTDGFNITYSGGHIYVTGTNGRGAAYGLLELSRKAGVSPWIWWGDVTPTRKERLTLPDDFTTTQGASVQYRGIFLNDEDWSLRPWSRETFEPESTSIIGPRTYKEIFKLLMRLRANAVWPAMHGGTTAFFKNPDNKLTADSCGIAVGTSHCEPLLRNNVDEWDVTQKGPFNYITNREAVHDYWTERLDLVRNSTGGNIFTIGMRGIHDGSMEGVKTRAEKFAALQRVIDDQQTLIAGHIGDPTKQMQVFVPYKEVLELYEQGLNVPDYVTLMWCDDNYGYITRLSDTQEQQRAGGAGVYYHLSYWGRPHDYLWLSTTQPGLICNEMHKAYGHNARKLWIANVHDPKVAAYNLELFLDMAWDISNVKPEDTGSHLKKWLSSNFGEEATTRLYPAMREYYRLCAERRPEFMGWSQVELDKKKYARGLSPVTDTELNFTEFGNEADRYIDEFQDIVQTVEEVETLIDPSLVDAYFAAIKYPVLCAAKNATKMIEAQRARNSIHEATDSVILISSAKSIKAYRDITALTRHYNNVMTNGKWQHSMDMQPRNLPSGGMPPLPKHLTDEQTDSILNSINRNRQTHTLETDGAIAYNACQYTSAVGNVRAIDMLGHSGKSIELNPGCELKYTFEITDTMHTPVLTLAMIPTHTDNNGNNRFKIRIDNNEPITYDLKEPFRSEKWKLNVLRQQAIRKTPLDKLTPGSHTLTITAIDRNIVADQWCIDPNPDRKYYLIPTENN